MPTQPSSNGIAHHKDDVASDFVSRPLGIDLRHLRYFLLVAEELHFGRAAARAGIDQSPLSRQILDLEDRIGFPLFSRDRRHTELTPAGEALAGDVRRLFTDLDVSIERARIVAAGAGQPFRVGLAEGAAGPEFGRFVQLARQLDPAIPLMLTEKPATKLFSLLARGGLDAAFTLSPSGDPDLDSEVIWRGRLCTVVAAGHWAAARDGIALADLRDEAWVMPHPDLIPGYAAQIDALLERHQVRPVRATLAGHQNSIGQLVAAGVGVGLVPEGITPLADAAVRVPLTDANAILEAWFVCPRQEHSPLLPCVRLLIERVALEHALPQPPA